MQCQRDTVNKDIKVHIQISLYMLGDCKGHIPAHLMKSK